jgi:hypothetical protein
MRILATFLVLALAGCSGIVVGRPGPGRGSITLTNSHSYVYTSGPQTGQTFSRDEDLGNTYNTILVAGLFGPARSTMSGSPTSTGLGFDAFGEFLHNTAGFFGFGLRAGYAYMGGDDMADFSYAGFPIMLQAAVGTRWPGPVDSGRSLLGSMSGLALSLHGGVGYVAGGSLGHGSASADVAGYRANLGLRLTLPITIVQFTLTAELSYTTTASAVALEGVDTSFDATSLLFGNIVAF